MVVGSGTIVPFTWILSTMVWRSLPFDWPPLNSNRRTSNGALLAPTGTAKLTICGCCVSSALGPAVKVAPPLVLYESCTEVKPFPLPLVAKLNVMF
jgi:hypothetical protein